MTDRCGDKNVTVSSLIGKVLKATLFPDIWPRLTSLPGYSLQLLRDVSTKSIPEQILPAPISRVCCRAQRETDSVLPVSASVTMYSTSPDYKRVSERSADLAAIH